MSGSHPQNAGSRAGPRGRILALVRQIPLARVVTIGNLSGQAAVPEALVATVLSRLSDDERTTLPWHRVVQNGGAIGRGPWREAQFSRLMREGIAVSPAGVVQDLGRVALADFSPAPPAAPAQPAMEPTPLRSRSRGMKDRPRS